MTQIAVLMGGPSAEHEISLKSGHGIAAALARRGHGVVEVAIPHASLEEAEAFVRRELQALKPEAVFIALHGTFGEDGTTQQICEELQIPYTGSDAAASRLGMDKVTAKQAFERAGLVVPRAQLIEVPAHQPLLRAPALKKGFAYPVVVKPASQGSSFGVSLVGGASAWGPAVADAARYGSRIVVEEFIAGRELTVGVLGEEALPVVEIRSPHAFFDFGAKYTPGATEYLVPAPLDEAVAKMVQAAGLAAHRALGCRHFSRADIILTARQVPVVLEVNTVPGFTPTSLLPKAAAQAGISYDALCEQLVMMAIAQRAPIGSAS